MGVLSLLPNNLQLNTPALNVENPAAKNIYTSMSMATILLLQEIPSYIVNNVIKLNKMKQTTKYLPRRRDYFVWEDEGLEHICIAGWETAYTIDYLVELIGENNLYPSNRVLKAAPMRAATAYEIAKLNDKLAGYRLWFDKERCELTRIPSLPTKFINPHLTQ